LHPTPRLAGYSARKVRFVENPLVDLSADCRVIRMTRSPGLSWLAVLLPIATGALGAQPSNSAAIDAARAGGVVIACRHAITERYEEDEMTMRYDDSATQRKLSPRGERQAEAMARAFRALRIDVGEAVTSHMQRARRTAELFGAARVTLDSAWHTRGTDYSGWKRDRRLEHLGGVPRRGNRLIVSHLGTMQSAIPAIRDGLEEGDCVVLRPEGGHRFDAIGVLRWRALLRAAQMSDSVPPA
jgi:phosphohistidine phosphatase SixA